MPPSDKPPTEDSKPPRLTTDADFIAGAQYFWPGCKKHRVVGPDVVCLNALEQTVVISKDAIQQRLNEAWPIPWPPDAPPKSRE